MKKIIAIITILITMTSNAQELTISEKKLIQKGNISEKMKIIQSDNITELKVLNTICKDINPNDPFTKILADRMFLSMRDPENPGIGIAAPQVGINRNLIWVQRFDKENYPFELYLNARIIWKSQLMQKGPEGCLSIPETKGDVLRHYAIKISYQTPEGISKEEIIEDFTAVVFQHEIDHLNGVLFPERISEQEKEEYILVNEQKDFFLLTKKQ